MIKFSDLKRKLTEDSEAPYDARYRVNPIGGNNEVDQADLAIFDLARPESISKINAFLGAAGAKPVIDPNGVLRHIQRKLSILGLQFSIPTADLSSRARYGFDNNKSMVGTNESKYTREYPLSYLGGRFGVLDDNYNIGYDDNISHRLGHGLKLQVEFITQQSGMTTVIPKIVNDVKKVTYLDKKSKPEKVKNVTPGQ